MHYSAVPISRVLLEVLYTLIIVGSTAAMVLLTRRLYRLSGHPGIGYFRNAMAFFGVGFLLRALAVWMAAYHYTTHPLLYRLLEVIFTYLICMGGFLLVFSLVWKQFEEVLHYTWVLHLVALAVAIVDEFFLPEIMYIVMLGVFSHAIRVSYDNYLLALKQKKRDFRQLYFVALVIGALGFLLHFLAQYVTPHMPSFPYYVYALTATIFLLFLYGVIQVTNTNGKKA